MFEGIVQGVGRMSRVEIAQKPHLRSATVSNSNAEIVDDITIPGRMSSISSTGLVAGLGADSVVNQSTAVVLTGKMPSVIGSSPFVAGV